MAAGNTTYDSRDNCNAIIETASNTLAVGCQSSVIPNSVTSIGDYAFEGCSGLTSLDIPNSVTSIGKSAFEDCSLTSLTIPNSVTNIGENAFEDCNSLQSVIIPESVTSISKGAFESCSALTDVTLPEGLISIGEEAFADCAIASVSLPQSLVRIGEQAFEECPLTTITLPMNVAYLGNEDRIGEYGEMIEEDDLYADVFYGCDLLTGVLVYEENQSYTSVDGMLMTKDRKTLLYIPGAMTEAIVPQGVETIYFGAVSSDHLTSITLPRSLQSIKTEGVYSRGLTSVIAKMEVPATTDYSAFSYFAYENATLYVPFGTKAAYEGTDGWKQFQHIVEMDLQPVDEGQSIDIVDEIDEHTDIDGNVVGDIYFCISGENGSYNAAEGCIVVTSPTDDSVIDGTDIFGENFKDNYTGIVFKVSAGKGTIKVEAQTTGNMVMKVKIGNADPITMELEGKLKASFPYNVSHDTYVYIYGGANSANAKGMRKAESAEGSLKIFGIEVNGETTGVESLDALSDGMATTYNLNGHRIAAPQRGINIIRMNDGTTRKVVVK